MVALVEHAQADKSRIQRLADRICGVFVLVVLAAAVLTLAGWLAAGSPAEPAATSSRRQISGLMPAITIRNR
jgi:Cu+-exporting ATPase